MRPVANTIVTVARRLAGDPTLLPEVLNKMLSRLTDGRHRKRIAAYSSLVVSPVEGLARVLGVTHSIVESLMEADSLRALLEELATYEIPPQARTMGGAAFLEACYAIVRVTRPAVVLETGVAHGYSTAVILHALAENGAGRLHSVDLPMFRSDVVAHTGGAVPARLRSAGGWELRIGPDRRVLPRLLERIGPVDLCFYDSDKSYEGMVRAARLVWGHLRPGGMLVLDDVNAHDAFLDFADAHGMAPLIIAKPTRRGVYHWDQVYCVGLLRKPGASPR
jgi:predicted O-methyltransferase YrrM